ncbi:MAG: lactate utilization protein [Aliarcobacter sp.]
MEKLLETLKFCGYNPHFVKNKEEAFELAKTFIKPNMSVGLGGSVSVQQIGLLEYLVNKEDIVLHNQYEAGISMEENIERRRQGLVSDIFVTSVNAISKDGKLINADGSGNRVAAFSYGPKNLLVIAGINKIVETLEDGFKRVMEVAAPKNIERINNVAIKMGKEPRYNLENIANKFSWVKADEDKGRIIIILVDEELGY